MALNKIISVKNVGRFLSAAASGDVTHRKNTLIFAPNGRGKTTLCAVLRSLQSGEPAYITGRQTLGSADPPDVRVLLASGPANFANEEWSTTLPQLAVFDATYITENVYSGEAVDTEQRRNLYRVIIGSDGVSLVRRLDDLEGQLRTKNTEIRDAKATVQRYMPPGMQIEEFLGFVQNERIDEVIAAKERELEAVKRTDQIQQRALLEEITLPHLAEGFTELLGRTLDGVGAEAERRVTDHIQHHEMGTRGEPWVSEGLGYIRDDHCPFCSQDLRGIDLIEAYRTFFSEAYHELRDEVGAMITSIEDSLGERQIAGVERTAEQNANGVEFWSDYCVFEAPLIPADINLTEALSNLRDAAISLLRRKQAALLEPLDPDEQYQTAVAAYETVSAAVVAYNGAVRTSNTALTAKKQEAGEADVQAVELELAWLKAQKARHTNDVSDQCEAYNTRLAEKIDLEGEKEEARAQLDAHTEALIEHYGQSINRNLARIRFNPGRILRQRRSSRIRWA